MIGFNISAARQSQIKGTSKIESRSCGGLKPVVRRKAYCSAGVTSSKLLYPFLFARGAKSALLSCPQALIKAISYGAVAQVATIWLRLLKIAPEGRITERRKRKRPGRRGVTLVPSETSPTSALKASPYIESFSWWLL
jgi:hypothetical protein